MELLSRLGRYVEDKSSIDLPALLSSGFPAGIGAELKLSSISEGRDSEDHCTTVGSAEPPSARHPECAMLPSCMRGSWAERRARARTRCLFTNSRSIPIGGLTPGKVYSFRVRAIGGSAGFGDWSEPVSHRCG